MSPEPRRGGSTCRLPAPSGLRTDAARLRINGSVSSGGVRPLRETPFSPGMPYRPWGVSSCALPEGFKDLDENIIR
jgi:hypothetical protein